jgi:uncharacterized protein (TIGR02328 family)
MRCWHKDLIPVLPMDQLGGEWRELSAIAGNILMKGSPKHLLVDKVMDYQMEHFMLYAELIRQECFNRGRRINPEVSDKIFSVCDTNNKITYDELFSEWHTDRYLRQCYYNLQEKYDCGGLTEEEWNKVETVCERIL